MIACLSTWVSGSLPGGPSTPQGRGKLQPAATESCRRAWGRARVGRFRLSSVSIERTTGNEPRPPRDALTTRDRLPASTRHGARDFAGSSPAVSAVSNELTGQHCRTCRRRLPSGGPDGAAMEPDRHAGRRRNAQESERPVSATRVRAAGTIVLPPSCSVRSGIGIVFSSDAVEVETGRGRPGDLRGRPAGLLMITQYNPILPKIPLSELPKPSALRAAGSRAESYPMAQSPRKRDARLTSVSKSRHGSRAAM